jgi:hypothetical protein
MTAVALGKGGFVTLYLNDKKVGEGRVDKTEYGRISADETFDTGLDPASPVSEDYQSHFRFPGTHRYGRDWHSAGQPRGKRSERLILAQLRDRLGTE